MNPAVNDEFMARGLTDKPWLVTAKRQAVYDKMYKNSGRGVADISATKGIGDYQGRKILEQLQKDTMSSNGFALTIIDDASGIIYNPLILNKGGLGSQSYGSTSKYLDKPLQKAIKKTWRPRDRESDMFESLVGASGSKVRDENLADYLSAHTEVLSSLRGRIDKHNISAIHNNETPHSVRRSPKKSGEAFS
ncbi:MAG: hypothetical protein QMC67_13590 [Candidatus Wallbacteria bacterium]